MMSLFYLHTLSLPRDEKLSEASRTSFRPTQICTMQDICLIHLFSEQREFLQPKTWLCHGLTSIFYSSKLKLEKLGRIF